MDIVLDTHLKYTILAYMIGKHDYLGVTYATQGIGAVLVETDEEYIIWTIYYQPEKGTWYCSNGTYVPKGEIGKAEMIYTERVWALIGR